MIQTLRIPAFAAAIALVLTGCATPSTPPAPTAPPSAEAPQAPPAAGGKVMVAAANPLAVEAGLAVLRKGGSAVDAAVAVQAVLGLVEPQSSGVGGGSFLVYYDAGSKTVTAYDGRETAPKAADSRLFLGPDGKPLPFVTAVLSGRSTGVPGAIGMLGEAQKAHGALPWSALFTDAEKLAGDGFIVSPRLAGMISSPFPQAAAPDAVRYFTKPDGTKYKAGDRLRNPAYAATLRTLASQGAGALYKGPLAEAIVARTHEGDLPGALTLADFAAYRPAAKPALCHPFRVYVVCTAQPPSSGVNLLQALAMLEHTDIDSRGPADPVGWIQLAQAERLMYADRDRYVGDPAFVSVPVQGLLNDGYLTERANLIGDKVGPAPKFGVPPGAPKRGVDATTEPGGTTHLVIVDAKGNVVSMTTTVESIFGSGRMTNGFFLNNQLTDFSFSPSDADGTPAANAPGGGKRPRSSMSPVIVLDRDGGFVAALGSPGGTSILSYNLKALVGTFDWKLPLQAAFDLPNMVAKDDRFSSEPTRFAPGVLDGMAARGLTLNNTAGEASGLHGVIVRPGGVLEGAADDRREGVAKGF